MLIFYSFKAILWSRKVVWNYFLKDIYPSKIEAILFNFLNDDDFKITRLTQSSSDHSFFSAKLQLATSLAASIRRYIFFRDFALQMADHLRLTAITPRNERDMYRGSRRCIIVVKLVHSYNLLFGCTEGKVN